MDLKNYKKEIYFYTKVELIEMDIDPDPLSIKLEYDDMNQILHVTMKYDNRFECTVQVPRNIMDKKDWLHLCCERISRAIREMLDPSWWDRKMQRYEKIEKEYHGDSEDHIYQNVDETH